MNSACEVLKPGDERVPVNSELPGRVLAVIAGHMHLRTRQGDERPWKLESDGTLYVNAARVPRIFSGEDDVYRHHVSVTIDEESLQVEEILTPQYG